MGSFVQPSMRIALLGISLLSCWGTMRVVTADAAIFDGMVDEAMAVLQLRFGSVVDRTSNGRVVHSTSSRPNASPDSRAAVEAGWDLIRARDYRGALHLLSQAKAASPNDPQLWLGIGVSRYRLSQFDSAKAALTEALHIDPSLDAAHVLLGELAFMRDELTEAIRHYVSAQEINPNDIVIQDGLYTARRAQQLEAGLVRMVTPHFVLKCDVSKQAEMRRVAARLESLYNRIGERLLYRPDARTVVILYPDRRFQQLTDSPAWAGGLFDGKIHLAAERVLHASPETNGVLAHEFSHALVHRLSGGRTPTWLDEGLALYFEGRGPVWSQAILDRRDIELTPLHALHGSFLSLPRREAALAYAESLSATGALIDRYGWGSVRQVLELLSTIDDFSAAFETAFKEPYHAFESFWMTSVSHRRS
jgi:tetratricopeptide (TPR) repeat protein